MGLGSIIEEIDNMTYGKKIFIDYDNFRGLRNNIAHRGAEVKFLDLKDEVQKISKFLEFFLEKSLENQKIPLITQKEMYLKILTKNIPVMSYMFLIYFKFYSYLLILDYIFSYWKDNN